MFFVSSPVLLSLIYFLHTDTFFYHIIPLQHRLLLYSHFASCTYHADFVILHYKKHNY